MKSKQCQKMKNPCKYCLQAVTNKNGLQCQGACKKWAHFKCLNFTPGKISDIKAGIIEVKCPCPDCETTAPKEVLSKPPYRCSNQQCPAHKLPMCESTECPSKDIAKPCPSKPQFSPSKSCPQTPSCTQPSTPSCQPQTCSPTLCPIPNCPTHSYPLESNQSTPLAPTHCCRTPSPPQHYPVESCPFKPCLLDELPCPVQHCPLLQHPIQQCPLQPSSCPGHQCTKQPCPMMACPQQHCSKLPCSPRPYQARPCPQISSPLPCTIPKCNKPPSSGCGKPTPSILTPLPVCANISQPHFRQNALVETDNEISTFITSVKSPTSSLLSSDDSAKILYDTSSLDSNLRTGQLSRSETLEDMNNKLDNLTTQMKNLMEKIAKD